MTEAPNTPSAGAISPDGQHQWDGTTWVANPNLPKVKKKHTVRNVFLIAIFVFIAGIAGCVALIGGAANELDKSITADSAEATKDVTIVKCPVPSAGEFAAPTAEVMIKNSSKVAQTYAGSVYVSKGDEQVGSGTILEDVKGSGSVKLSVDLFAPGTKDLKSSDIKGAECTLQEMTAFETETK